MDVLHKLTAAAQEYADAALAAAHRHQQQAAAQGGGFHRVGSGKGGVEFWVAPVKPGRVLYEVEGVTEDVARQAFRLAAAKLPVRTVFVTRTVM